MKVIYLDQNKWIDIARIFLGKKCDPDSLKLKELIETKVRTKEWVFPLSIIHHFETSIRKDDRTRGELAETMGQISLNYSILPYLHTEKLEMENLLNRLYSVQEIDLKSIIIGQDFAKSTGCNMEELYRTFQSEEALPATKEVFDYFNNNLNLFKFFLGPAQAQELIDEQTDANASYVEGYEKIRNYYSKIPKQYSYKVFLFKNFMENFEPALLKYKKTNNNKILLPDFNSDNSSAVDFMESLPCFSVRMYLSYQIINNVGREFQKNDFKDIAFLSVAIPYCDVVITEKFWMNLAERKKMGERFDTVVTNNINYLLQID